MRVRRVTREAGTCRADLCDSLVLCVEALSGEGYYPRAFCADHARERDLELSIRNASGQTAEVVLLSDWERGPDGRVRRKIDGDASGIVD